MKIQFWLGLIQQWRAIAVIRASRLEQGRQMAHAVAAGGMRLIEITWNSDRALELIAQLRTELPDCVIGAGTLLSVEQMKLSIAAGAQFLFTPHVAPELIQIAVNENIPIVAGALSPTEIVTAWQLGATCVKVFPIQAVGGATYIQSLQGPLGEIPLIPTGGVTVENAKEFLTVGAIAVGLSGSLFPKQVLQDGNWDAITHQAKLLQQRVASVAMRSE